MRNQHIALYFKCGLVFSTVPNLRPYLRYLPFFSDSADRGKDRNSAVSSAARKTCCFKRVPGLSCSSPLCVALFACCSYRLLQFGFRTTKRPLLLPCLCHNLQQSNRSASSHPRLFEFSPHSRVAGCPPHASTAVQALGRKHCCFGDLARRPQVDRCYGNTQDAKSNVCLTSK